MLTHCMALCVKGIVIISIKHDSHLLEVIESWGNVVIHIGYLPSYLSEHFTCSRQCPRIVSIEMVILGIHAPSSKRLHPAHHDGRSQTERQLDGDDDVMGLQYEEPDGCIVFEHGFSFH